MVSSGEATGRALPEATWPRLKGSKGAGPVACGPRPHPRVAGSPWEPLGVLSRTEALRTPPHHPSPLAPPPTASICQYEAIYLGV